MTQNHYQVLVSEVLFSARPPRGRRGGAGRDATSLRGIRPHGSPPNKRHGSAGLASAWGRPGSADESDRGSTPVATPVRDVAKPKRR